MKVLIFTLLALSALVSCKKNYRCECTTKKYYGIYQSSDGVWKHEFYTPTMKTIIIKDNREDAKATCKTFGTSFKEPGPHAQSTSGQDSTNVAISCFVNIN